jgi:hypothetical protein
MHLAPRLPVTWVQGNWSFISLRHRERGLRVSGVTMSADHRKDLAIANCGEHGGGVRAWIDDDDLLVVTDDPGVGGGRY